MTISRSCSLPSSDRMLWHFCSFLLFGCFIFFPLHQTYGLKLDLKADGGVTCQNESKQCRALKNVRVTYGNYHSHSDELEVFFKTDKSLERIKAKGHIRLNHGLSHQASGQSIVYNIDLGTLKLRGPGILEEKSRQLSIHADLFNFQLTKDQQLKKADIPNLFRLSTPTLVTTGTGGHFQMADGSYSIDQRVSIFFDKGTIWGSCANGNYRQEHHEIHKKQEPTYQEENQQSIDDLVQVLLIRKQRPMTSS